MSARYLTEGDVTVRRAAAILEPYVTQWYDDFVNDASLDRLVGLTIVVTDRAREGDRHFAATRDDGRLILLSPQLIELPPTTASGIVGHEFGHAADFAYPAQWAKSARGGWTLLDVTKRGASRETAFPAEWLRDWRARDDDTLERTADGIAETVGKVRIGYSGPCMLQTIGRGVRPRPRGLR